MASPDRLAAMQHEAREQAHIPPLQPRTHDLRAAVNLKLTPVATQIHAFDATTVRDAARYFAAIPLTQWVRVVEAETVPKTRVAAGALLPTGEGTEPLGERIIELPESLELCDLRDARSGFVAYVPPGSIAKGCEMVANGAGGVPCGTCHGAELRGAGPIPGIAGRSPSYTVRQLYDFQHGIRAGP